VVGQPRRSYAFLVSREGFISSPSGSIQVRSGVSSAQLHPHPYRTVPSFLPRPLTPLFEKSNVLVMYICSLCFELNSYLYFWAEDRLVQVRKLSHHLLLTPEAGFEQERHFWHEHLLRFLTFPSLLVMRRHSHR
jgi:hypothetical protein